MPERNSYEIIKSETHSSFAQLSVFTGNSYCLVLAIIIKGSIVDRMILRLIWAGKF